jgi:hypothetical protein
MLTGRKESSGGAEDGGVVDDGGSPPEYTITPIADGDLQTYTVRWHTSNGTDKIQKSCTGVQFNKLTMTLDPIARPKTPVKLSLGFMGKFMQPVVVNTETDYNLILADDIDTPFYFDSSTVFTFDGVDLTDYVELIGYSLDTLNRMEGDKDNHQPTEQLTGDRIHMLTFRLRRSDLVSIFDKYMDQAGDKGRPDNITYPVVIQVFNANGRSIKLTLSNVLIKSCKINNAVVKHGETPSYDFTCRVRKASYVMDDGITTKALYGISV